MATIDLGDGNIEDRELVEEMRSSYMDYAMSVIVGRALPDVRDGLKPVHRRVLFTMQDLGLQPNRPYVKCARVVGDCMGKYHPHGDSAIYDTLVRLGQTFASRYPLVDTQGNFGNIDGDPAAAMRYTECRLSPIAVEMLRDLDEDVVDFEPNYDEQNQMPTVMPARFPNLLANGSAGIAVGMATNIPPHNLREIIAGAIALIDDPLITTDGLMEHVKGPDFPTGGVIMGLAGIRDAYEHGRGRIRVRAVAHIEPQKGGHDAIIITELPYQVRKGGDDGVLAKIAELVHEKVITGIRDIADQSDRNGMRIWIELKRGEMAKVVLNQLYKHTPLQTTFGANVVTLVGGTPRTLGLKALLRHYVDHQKEVITRRTKFRLQRAQDRLHVLEGYLIALDNLDRVIAVIRGSADSDAAREALMSEFGLSELQARAILDLRLRALTALQQDEVRKEHGELVALVTELRSILADEARVYGIVKEELSELGRRFGDDRRTEILPAEGELDLEQLIREEDMVISITQTGYIKRVAASTYRQQKRGGVGVMGMDTKDDDWIEHLLVASTHDYVLFFTSVGKVYRLKVHELPEGNRQGRGRAVVNLLPLREGERVRTVIATRDFGEGLYLVQATKGGIVKKTLFKEYDTPRKSDGIIAINIREGDELIGVRLTSGEDDVLLTSRKGQTVRFDENEARAMGRATGGVIGMKLRKGDEVIAIDVADDTADLLVITENGYGKRTRVVRVPAQGPRHDGRAHDPAGRGARSDRRCARRGAAAGDPAHHRVRDRPAHGRRRHLADVARHAGRDRPAPARGRPHLGRRDGRHERRGRRARGRSAPARAARRRSACRRRHGDPRRRRCSRRRRRGGRRRDRRGRRRRRRGRLLRGGALGRRARRRRRRGRRRRLLDRLRHVGERPQDVDRDRQDRGRVVRRRDLQQGLQIAQLQGDRARGDAIGGLAQLLGGLVLALRADDLRAPLALGLCLTRHRALHRRGQLDVLDLDDRDLDAPGRGVRVDDVLQDPVDLVALGEQLVERVLAEHGAQGRLRDLRRGNEVVLDLRHRRLRIDDAEVGDRGHAHRDVVLGDDLLRRDRERDGAQVGLDHPVDQRHEQDQPRALGAREQPAEPEDHAALVLPQDTDRRGDHEDGDDDEGDSDSQQGVHTGILRRSMSARAARPSLRQARARHRA